MNPIDRVEKRYITAQELLEDAFRLGADIIHSGFRPDFIVGIWRGGSPISIAVHELLTYFEQPAEHIGIRTALYEGVAQPAGQVQVYGLAGLVERLQADAALLLVDDVFDSGRSIEAVITQLRARAGNHAPRHIKVAMPWFKPANNITARVPDFFLHTTAQWLVFPHEIRGLTTAELAVGKPALYDIMRTVNRCNS